MRDLLNKLINRQELSFDDTYNAILWIMSDKATPVTASAFLALLQARGARVDEIAGATKAMRKKAIKIKAPENVVDTCSTGGNGISTFNISTCAAIIASAAGAVVAKHGNQTNTRKSGSAEALEALGVNINLNVPAVEKCLQEIGLCFCYAIKHHPCMKYAGPIRKELGIPTIFNILGPLTNPANAKRQIIGVPKAEWTTLLTQVLKRLGSKHVIVAHGEDGLCELTTTAPTRIAELKNGNIKTYTINPEKLGFKEVQLKDMVINSPIDSAHIIEEILSGETGPNRDIAVLNSSAALVVSDLAEDLEDGIEKAEKAIDSGKALKKLKDLVEFSRQN